MTTQLCPKHGDPRDTSIMRPKDAPCSCTDAEYYYSLTHEEPEYTFMEHLRVFYPAEYKRRARETSK